MRAALGSVWHGACLSTHLMGDYLYRSVAGDFTIQKIEQGFALCIDGRQLRRCRSVAEAVLAVYTHDTYWKEWDAVLRGFVEPPACISEWEKVP